MLLALRDFIKRHQVVSTEQLGREFRIALDALEPILAIWIHKGSIRQAQDKKGCGTSCRSCRVQPIVYYEWCGS